MINEKMLELLLLEQYSSGNFNYSSDFYLIDGELYDTQSILDRLEELRSEFLETYRINSTLKKE